MDDKKFKDMWQKANFILGNSRYDLSSIESFMSSSSKQISTKIVKLYQGDIVIKCIIFTVLVLDMLLYFRVQYKISYICLCLMPVVGGLTMFEYRLLKEFKMTTDNFQDVNTRLSKMLRFLNAKSFISLLSIATTYLFGFTSMMLLYFFIEYGELRRMGSLDLFVFPSICLLGIIFTFVFNRKNMRSQEQHIELCLSDIDDNLLPIAKEKMELQQKNERIITILIGFVVLLSFLVLVAILKTKGF